MKNSTTDDLLQELTAAEDLDAYFARNSARQTDIALAPYLQGLLDEKGVTRAAVIRKAKMATPYVYQLFDGRRTNPSRETMLQLLFGFGLNIEEAQRLLRVARVGALYPKDKRDSVILFALEHGRSLDETNDMLYEKSMRVLGDEK